MSRYEQTTQTTIDIIERAYNEYPHLSYTKLARIIAASGGLDNTDNPEHIRKIVGYVLQNKVEKQEIDFEAEFGEMPISEYEELKTYEIPYHIKKPGIMGDIHVPYHSPQSVRTAIDALRDIDIDCLLLNGDAMDCYSISRFSKSLSRRDINHEIEQMNKFLDYLQNKFSTIIYKFGNHEARYARHFQENDPTFAEVNNSSLHEALNLVQRKIKWVEPRQLIKLGKLTIIHGDEIYGGGEINTAHNKLMKAFDNVLFGHHHKTQESYTTSINGDVFGSWSVGCLCGLRPDWSSVVNKWMHGFAYVERFDNDLFEVHNKKIINNKVI